MSERVQSRPRVYVRKTATVQTRKGAYSEEPGSAYASDASPCENHGHIHRTCTEGTSNEEEQQ